MKKIVIRGLIILVCIAGFIFLTKSLYKLSPNQTALITKFGRVVDSQNTPGLHMHSFIESDVKIYTGEYLYDIPTSDVITADKKSMIADNYIIWHVSEPIKYYQTLSATKGRAEERLEAAVFNATKNVISSMTQDDIVAEQLSLLEYVDPFTGDSYEGLSCTFTYETDKITVKAKRDDNVETKVYTLTDGVVTKYADDYGYDEFTYKDGKLIGFKAWEKNEESGEMETDELFDFSWNENVIASYGSAGGIVGAAVLYALTTTDGSADVGEPELRKPLRLPARLAEKRLGVDARGHEPLDSHALLAQAEQHWARDSGVWGADQRRLGWLGG